jgi:hypothetical protein
MLVAIVVVAGLVLLLDWACKSLPICGVSCCQLARWGTAGRGMLLQGWPLALTSLVSIVSCIHAIKSVTWLLVAAARLYTHPLVAIDDAVLVEWLP